MKLLFAAAVIMSVAIGSPALAQRVSKLSGGQLGQMCSKAQGAKLCDAYVSGVMDGAIWQQLYNRHLQDKGDPAFCVPKDESLEGIRGHLVSWIKAHPDSLKEPAGRVIFQAFHQGYACSAQVQRDEKRPA